MATFQHQASKTKARMANDLFFFFLISGKSIFQAKEVWFVRFHQKVIEICQEKNNIENQSTNKKGELKLAMKKKKKDTCTKFFLSPSETNSVRCFEYFFKFSSKFQVRPKARVKHQPLGSLNPVHSTMTR